MSRKHAKVEGLLNRKGTAGGHRHLAAYVACFNEGRFYEAHDVLEAHWLPRRRHAEGDFYKGLIQLAGAFVHLQKDRLQPAAALFCLALVNLERYPGNPDGLEVAAVRELAARWLCAVRTSGANPLRQDQPRIRFPAAASQPELPAIAPGTDLLASPPE